jgi:Zn finger protein HypA/HybF involved in hydrogenase expression
MDFMEQIQANMICNACKQESPVKVNVYDESEIEAIKQPINNREIPITHEQISCPKCGEDNFWDRNRRRFVDV